MRKKGIVVGIIILFIGAVVAPSISSISYQSKLKNTSIGTASFDPFKEGWTYQKMITINNDKVAGNLINFPVLISTTDSDLRDKAQDDGDDILFMDDKGEANQLYHEIEYFDDTSGELVAWVNIPSLSYIVDTIFYMYYGNASCGNQQDPENVWDSDYLMVQHMNGFSAYDIDDSTSNNNDVASYGGDPAFERTGKVGYCVEFDGDDCLVIPKGPWDFDGEVTIAWWLDIGGSQDSYEASMTTANKGTPTNGWWIEHGTAREANMHELGGVVVDSFELNSLSPNTFYYMAITKDNSDDTKWYKNAGDVTGLINSHSGIIGDDNYDLALGRYVWENYYNALSGKLDEIRISTIARSTDWIATEYQNQNEPSSFLSFGFEETGAPPDNPIIDGPTVGKPGVSYEYTFTTTDPDNDQVYYYVDWGDTSVQDWFGPFNSGDKATASHTWSEGNYEIKVKAKDTRGLESEWSNPFPINMPRNKIVNKPLLNFLQSHPNLFPILQKLLQGFGL